MIIELFLNFLNWVCDSIVVPSDAPKPSIWLSKLDFNAIATWDIHTCLQFILISETALHNAIKEVSHDELTASMVKVAVYHRIHTFIYPENTVRTQFQFKVGAPRNSYIKFDTMKNAYLIDVLTSIYDLVPSMLAGGPSRFMNKRMGQIIDKLPPHLCL